MGSIFGGAQSIPTNQFTNQNVTQDASQTTAANQYAQNIGTQLTNALGAFSGLNNYGALSPLPQLQTVPWTGADSASLTNALTFGTVNPWLTTQVGNDLTQGAQYMSQANEYLNPNGMAANLVNQGAGLINQAPQYFSQGANIIGQSLPFFNQGAGYFNQGANLAAQAPNIFNQGANYYNLGAGYAQQAPQYFGQGASMVSQSGAPITADDINSFYNPFASNVMANLQDIFGQQNLANRIGATAQSGGVGAERSAVGEALLARQQGLTAGGVFADLYQRALQAAQQQKAQQLASGQGMYGAGQGMLGTAQGLYGAGAGIYGQGQGYLSAAQSLYGAGQGLYGAGQGYLGAGQGMYGAGQGYLGAGQGLVGAGGTVGGIASALGNLGQQLGGLGLQGGQLSLAGNQQMQQQAAYLAQRLQEANQAQYQYGMGLYQQPLLTSQAMTQSLPGLIGLGQTGVQQTTGQQTGFGLGSTTYPAPSPISQIAGLGTLGVGLYGLLSDPRAKTDIQKAGYDPASKLPMYAFRYKGDPKTYPKVVGPMTTDVEKKYPSMVRHLAPHRQYGGPVTGDDSSNTVDVNDSDVTNASDDSDTSGLDQQAQQAQQQLRRQKSAQQYAKMLQQLQASQQTFRNLASHPKVPGIQFPVTPWQLGRIPMPQPLGGVFGRSSRGGRTYQEGGSVSDQKDDSVLPDVVAAETIDQATQGAPAAAPAAAPSDAAPNPNQGIIDFLGSRPDITGDPTSEASINEVGQYGGDPQRYLAVHDFTGPQPQKDIVDFLARRPDLTGEPASEASIAGVERFGGPEGFMAAQNAANAPPAAPPGPDWAGMGFGTAGQYVGARDLYNSQFGGRPGTPFDALPPAAKANYSMQANWVPFWQFSNAGFRRRAGGRIPGYQDSGRVLADEDMADVAAADALDGDDSGDEHEPTGLPTQESIPLPREKPKELGAPPQPPTTEPPAGFGPRRGGGYPGLGGLLSGRGASAGSANPYMALMQAGLGMLAASGQRDAHGLPMSPLGAIGAGGLVGMQSYQQGLAQEQKMQLAREMEARRELTARQAMGLKLQALQNLERHRRALEVGRTPRPIKMTDPNTGENYLVHPETGQRIGSPAASGTTDETLATGTPAPFSGLTPGVAATSADAEKIAEDEGTMPANAQLVQHGQFDYSTGSPGEIQKGFDVPNPAPITGPVGQQSSQQLIQDAYNYLEQGNKGLPTVSRGNSPVARQQQKYQNAVKNYANALAQSAGMTPQELAHQWRMNPYAVRWSLGLQGRSATGMGTAMRHLDSLEEAYKALDNGDIQALNEIKARLGIAVGAPAPVALNAMRQIVGTEIIKGLGVAQGGTYEERKQAADAYALRLSPEQFRATKGEVQGLLAGQLIGRLGEAEVNGVKQKDFAHQVGEDQFKQLQEIAKRRSGSKPFTPLSAPETSTAPSMPNISSKAEYEKLPSGATFMMNGKQYRKP